MKYRFLLVCLLIVAMLLSCKPSEEEAAAQITQIARQVLATQAAQFTPTPTLGAGSSRYSDKEGMFMVYVPGGEYVLGSDLGQLEWFFEECDNKKPLFCGLHRTLEGGPALIYQDEFPSHTVSLDPFWIDQTEVTNAMFAQFVNETGYQTTAEQLGYAYVPSRDDHEPRLAAYWRQPIAKETNATMRASYPAVSVSWYDAWAYCKWAGKRLPTEAEWEAAARGPESFIFPWGNSMPDVQLANIDGVNYPGNDIAPASSYPDGASPFKVYNLSGNALEWVYDGYAPSYDELPGLQNPIYPNGFEFRVVRGGSFANKPTSGRASDREKMSPLFSASDLGFRCVDSGLSLPEPPSMELPEIAILGNSEVNFLPARYKIGNLYSTGTEDVNVHVLAQYEDCNWLKVSSPDLPEGWIGGESYISLYVGRAGIILYRSCSEIEQPRMKENASDYADLLELFRAIDEAILLQPEYFHKGVFDKNISVPCPFGGSFTFGPSTAGASFTFEACAHTRGFVLTGTGSDKYEKYPDETGQFSIEAQVSGDKSGNLTYSRHYNENGIFMSVIGEYGGEVIDLQEEITDTLQ